MASFHEIIPSFSLQSRTGSGFDLLGWHHIGWDLQNWIASLIIPIVVLMVAFVIVLVISRWHSRVTTFEKKKRDSTNRFNAMLKRCRIADEERACIDTLHGFAPEEEKIAVIERPELFERCVDAAISNAASGNPQTLEESARVIASLRKKIGLAIYPTDKHITSTRAIPMGQVCSVFGSASNRDPVIKSATVAINNERSMHLRYKRDDDRPPELAAGELVRIAFSRANDGYYGAQVRLLGTPLRDSIEVSHSIDMKRSQLRKFVRVSASTRVKCRMITPANKEKPSQPTGKSIEADMHDLSGGGLSFTHTESLQAGDLVSLGFHIGDAHIAGLKATILRIGERTVKGQQMFLHHCKFNPIEISDQEKIVKFTFERMRLLTTWNMKKFN